MQLREIAGLAVGALVAPFTGLGSLLRRTRVVHASGIVFKADVKAAATATGAAGDVGARLEGPAIVRLSSGLWPVDKERRPDLLGATVRFRKDETPSAAPDKTDQDVLFATLRNALLFLPALLTTNVRTFLGDDYYAVGVFDAAELGRVKLRLLTPHIPASEKNRVESLRDAVDQGLAVFELQARELRMGARWETIARIRLTEEAPEIDQQALRFSPFRAGRGIVARGFLNAARILPYAASQLARPSSRE
jgi:hypothetical protein